MIFCFSGTGNSRRVAERLSRLLGEEVTEMNRTTYEVAASVPVADGLTVWVFPVHSWGLPDFVVRFMRRVGGGCGAGVAGRHYMVCTCGDDIGLAHRQWRRLVADRGWRPMAAYSVQMPNTYVVFPGFDVDSQETARRKLDASEDRVVSVASMIMSGATADDVEEGALPWIKSHLVYPYFMKRMISPEPFRVDAGRCIGCGRCENACPLGNVRLGAGRLPAWGADCTMCLGCYHVCPRHAVEYGRRTRGKGQYYCPNS